ncbi:hypothetical protein Tco_1477928, partial [Tanacetum coccineum]
RLANLELGIKKTVHKNMRGKIDEVANLLRQSAKHHMQLIMYIEQILHSTVKIPTNLLLEIVTTKNITTMVNKTSADMTGLVELVSRIACNMDTSPPPFSVAAKGEKSAQA